MALEIWLKGEFDIGALYEFARDNDDFCKVTELERGRFTFHLREVKDVVYQAYTGGNVRIVTDDYSDLSALVQIIWNAAWVASNKPPMFKLKKIQPLDTTCYRIARPLIRSRLKLGGPNGKDEAAAIIEEVSLQIRSVKGKLIELWRKTSQQASPCPGRRAHSRGSTEFSKDGRPAVEG